MGKKFVVGLSAMAFAALTVTSYAQQPVTVGRGIEVSPIRMAKITADGNIGKWVPYTKGEVKSQAAWMVSFDAFEADQGDANYPFSAPADNQYGVDCGLAGSRWYFGETYNNTMVCGDMNLAAGTNGKFAEGVNLSWFWYVTGPGSSEQCYIAVFTTEDVDETGNGTDPAFDNPYAGVLYDFGVLNSGSGAGFYYTNIDLTGSGLSHEMPHDGRGGWLTYFARLNDGTGGGPGGLTKATLAQMMLWGPQGTNPSSQNEYQYDDDNPAPDDDFALGNYDQTSCPTCERYTYAFGICPDPLCGSIAFYVADTGGNPEKICATSTAIQFGSLVSGSVTDTCLSDDVRMVVRNGNVFIITQSPITVEFNGGVTTILNPTSVEMTCENRVSLGGLTVRIDMRNYTTNSWEQVDQRAGSVGSDTVVTVLKTANAGDYVGAAGEVANRYRVRDDTPAFLASWTGQVDAIYSTVNP